MRKRNNLMLIIILAVISLVLYVVNVLIFKDIHHVAIFALEDLVFVPIEVIFVILIFRRVLANNEKKKKISKLGYRNIFQRGRHRTASGICAQ